MNPVENHGDWMRGISGSRRMTSESPTEDPAAIDEMTTEPQRGQRGTAPLSAGDSSFAASATPSGKGIWARLGWCGNDRQSGDRPHLLAFSETGPVDWIEAIRGNLFFGIVAITVWLEWVAIKTLATHMATYF